MTTRLDRIGNFETFGNGNMATIRLPIGPTYLTHMLHMKATIGGSTQNVPSTDWANHIDKVRIRADGDDWVEWDIAELLKYNNLYGIPMRAGVLPIDLRMKWAQTLAGQMYSVHGTQGLRTYTIELEIADGADVQMIDLYAHTAGPQPAGNYYSVRRFTDSRASTGEQSLKTIQPGNHWLAGLMFNKTGISDLEVKATALNGQRGTVYNLNNEVREWSYKDAGRVAQAACTLIDLTPINQVVTPTLEGPVPELFDMNLADFEMIVNWTTAPNDFVIHAIEVRND